jgi:hypothetical protein
MCGSSFKGYLEVSLGMETINEFGAVNLKYGPLYDNEDLLLEINPLSPPSDPVQRRLQSPPAKSNFLAVSNNIHKKAPGGAARPGG